MKKNRLIFAGLVFAALLLIGLCAYNGYGKAAKGEGTARGAVSDTQGEKEAQTEQQRDEAEHTRRGK